MTDQTNERFHWGWVITSAAIGVALMTLAHLASLAWHWPDVTTGVLSDLGVAFLFAFVLFVLERRFTRSVTRQVKAAAETATVARTTELGNRLDDLEARISAREAATQLEQDDVVTAIAEDLSHESIRDALLEAARVGAIQGGKLTVPGSTTEPWMAVEFRYGVTSIPPQYMSLIGDRPRHPRLLVSIEVRRGERETGRPVVEVEWSEELSSEEVGEALLTELRRASRLHEAKVFNFAHALRELQRGLQLAFENQRTPLGEERFHGALVEVIDGDWIITSDGLANVSTGYCWQWREHLATRRTKPRTSPPTPDGVTPELWSYVLYRLDEAEPSTLLV